MKKRLLSILMALALCLSLLPAAALAADPVTGVPYLDENGTSQTCASAKVVESDTIQWVRNWYVVQGTVEIDSRVTVGGPVYLILTDGCELIINGGIEVQDDDDDPENGSRNTLTIYGQAGGTGKLTTQNVEDSNAGIGGTISFADGHGCGEITINGGYIEATSYKGAGIGGGYSSGTGGYGGIITINGGTVTATSTYGAGIGGGFGGSTAGGNGGKITINGGTVTATSTYGAGIGGGGSDRLAGDGGKITINGGIVEAISTKGAGIGGGGIDTISGVSGGDGGNITISGGTVTATSNDNGAGIGGGGAGIGSGNGGDGGDGGNITISGGTVTATSTGKGVGIGGGFYGNQGTFQTQKEDESNGSAVIFASSIGDQSNKGDWSGIIFDVSSGAVYGDQTLTGDLTIPSGASLTIPAGKTLINKGTISIDGGTLTNNGTIINFGTITGTVSGNQPKDGVTAKYLDENGKEQTAFCDAAITADNPLTTWGEADKTTWYVVQGDVAFGTEGTYQHVNTKGDVHLILADGCTLTLADGLTASGDLTIYAQSTGDAQGSMSVYETGETLDSYAIRVNGNFTINGSIIDAKSIVSDKRSFGIVAYNMTVNGGSVTATGDGASLSAGIYVEVNGDDSGTMTISGGSVTATGGLGENDSCGIYAGKELIIEGGTVKAKGGDTPKIEGVTLTNRSIGICSPEVTIEGGTVEANGGSVDAGSYGILAVSELSITGGSVEATGGDATESCGIYAGDITGKTADIGSVTITANAKVTATGGEAGSRSCGIFAIKGLTVTGDAEVTAAGGEAQYSYGIRADKELTINGSTVKAEGGSAADSTGIYATKQLTMTGSTVKVKGGNAKDFSRGINSAGVVTIAGGSVEVKAGTAGTSSTGIYTFGVVTIAGGSHVTVDSLLNGTSGHAMNKRPQLPETYWWRTADTDPFTASGTAEYEYYYGDAYVEFTDSFTITLDPNFDGGESGTLTTGTDGKLTGELPTPTRGGYIFDGWFTAATGGTEVTNETAFNGYVTIYAHWTLKSTGGGSTPTYAPTVTQPENGTVTVSPKSPRKGVTVTITPTPDAGYTVEQVLVTDKNGDPVEVINNGDGTYSFTQPAGKVNINVTFMEDNSMLNFFVDVFPGDYYYDAVLWAAENGITGGVDDTHFAPNAPCTRAQIVTFLWRAAGCPEPETLSSFADVPADNYYAKAVAWAVENGITTGTSDTAFSPNATCTRAQAMTFIYRSVQAQGGGLEGEWMFQNPFSDVNLESYYGEAVMWAVANGVTTGTSDTAFSPSNDCTRAQIVTFLYRCLGGE